MKQSRLIAADPGCKGEASTACPRVKLCILTLALLGLSACTDMLNSSPSQTEPTTQAPQPDWVSTEGSPPKPAQLGMTPQARNGHPLDPLPEGVHWRLWRYEVPGIKQLSLPRKQPMDIALLGLDGRIKALKHQAICHPEDCDPIKPEFPAIAILIARPGTFQDVGLDVGSTIRYGQPSRQVSHSIALH